MLFQKTRACLPEKRDQANETKGMQQINDFKAWSYHDTNVIGFDFAAGLYNGSESRGAHFGTALLGGNFQGVDIEGL